jgi:hypothetical protein
MRQAFMRTAASPRERCAHSGTCLTAPHCLPAAACARSARRRSRPRPLAAPSAGAAQNGGFGPLGASGGVGQGRVCRLCMPAHSDPSQPAPTPPPPPLLPAMRSHRCCTSRCAARAPPRGARRRWRRRRPPRSRRRARARARAGQGANRRRCPALCRPPSLPSPWGAALPPARLQASPPSSLQVPPWPLFPSHDSPMPRFLSRLAAPSQPRPLPAPDRRPPALLALPRPALELLGRCRRIAAAPTPRSAAGGRLIAAPPPPTLPGPIHLEPPAPLPATPTPCC